MATTKKPRTSHMDLTCDVATMLQLDDYAARQIAADGKRGISRSAAVRKLIIEQHQRDTDAFLAK
jgi:hypothetical protein